MISTLPSIQTPTQTINRSAPATPPPIPYPHNGMSGAFGNANRQAMALSRGVQPEMSFAPMLPRSPLMQQYLTQPQQAALSAPRVPLEQLIAPPPAPTPAQTQSDPYEALRLYLKNLGFL